MMLKAFALVFGVLLTSVGSAGEFHWTGGSGARWTDDGNWLEGEVPQAGDIAIFAATGEDRTIDLEGMDAVKAVYVREAGTGRYTFGVAGGASEQVLQLVKNGALVVEESVTQMPTLNCGISVGEQGGVTCITNDVAGAELVIGNIGYTTSSSWTSATAEFAGKGDLRWVGKVTSLSRLSTTHAHKGKFYYASVSGSMGTFNVSTGCGGIEITEGAVRQMRMDGYGLGTVSASPGPLMITGDGTFQFCAGKTENTQNPAKWNNASINLGYMDVVIATATIEGYDSQPAAGYQVGIRTSSSSSAPNGWNTGTLVLDSTNCCLSGDIEFYSSAALKVSSFGLKGEQSRVGWCTNFYLCNNARMIYTGPGETTDRNLHFGRTCHARDSASSAAVLNAPAFSFDQSGTGKFIVASSLDVAEAETVDDSFRPVLTLTGNSSADGEWAGVLALDRLSVVKQGTGRWILSSADNEIRGGLIVSNGTLRVDHPSTLQQSTEIALAGGTLEFPAAATAAATLPPVNVPANATLRLGSGASVTFASLSVAAGKTLALVTEDDSVNVKLAEGRPAGALPQVTINGMPAMINEQGAVVAPGTAWNNAQGGSWHETANWTGGVPSALGESRIALGGSFGVSVDSAAVCSNLTVRNFTGATKVSLDAPLTVSPQAVLAVAGRSTMEVNAGGSLKTANATSISFTDGAVVKVNGGGVDFAGGNARPTFSSADASVTGGIRLVSGAFTNNATASAGALALEKGATIEAEGGKLILNSGGWFADLARIQGSMRHVFGGETWVDYSGNSTAAFRADGTFDFKDDAVLGSTICNGGLCAFTPLTVGQTLELNFTDRARLYMWDYQNNSFSTIFTLGCPSSVMSSGPEPVARLTFDSNATHAMSGLWAGIERSGTAEVVLKRGALMLYTRGLMLGSFWESYWISGSRARGVFKMLDGVLSVSGHYYSGSQNHMCGLVVGAGTYDGAGNETHPRYDNYRFSGRFELDGGLVTNGMGYVAVGVGRADGELIQRGGSMVIGTEWAARASVADGGHPGLYAVGALTGSGLWAVSNGMVKAMTALQPMYVGGVSAYTIGEHCWRSLTNLAPENFLTSYPAEANAATGCLEVVNGTFESLGDLFVGGDGRGEVRLVGSEGGVKFRNLVMSNNVESVAHYVFDANGVKPFVCTGSATVTDGAKLVIDVSNFTGRRNNHPLITAAGGMTGRFAEVEVIGDNQAARLGVVVQAAEGVRFVIQRGMTINFR